MWKTIFSVYFYEIKVVTNYFFSDLFAISNSKQESVETMVQT